MKKEIITSVFSNDVIMSPEGDFARNVYEKSRFGEPKGKKFYYSSVEALYLLEEGKMEVIDGRGKSLDFDDFVKKAKKLDSRLLVRYLVYKEMRKRGYIVKTALKFGADFRVYERGVKPVQAHAKWILFPVYEGSTLTWQEFAAKNRVAHSTKKNLLIAVVDEESDVTYYEIVWTRP